MKKVGKRQKHGMRHGMMAFGPKIRTGMKATGLRICIARMSMDISRRKEKEKVKERKDRKERKERKDRKERKERTARTMKVMENRVMKKAYRTMFKLQPRQLLLKDNKLNTLLERQVHQLMVSL